MSHEYGRVSAFIEWIHTCERMEGRVVYISISKLKDILLTVFKNFTLATVFKTLFSEEGEKLVARDFRHKNIKDGEIGNSSYFSG